MRRLAFAAFCGACILFATAAAASDADTKKNATPQGESATVRDVNDLITQIPLLQQIGDEIAKNQEAFEQLKIRLQRQRWNARHAAATAPQQGGNRLWSYYWNKDTRRAVRRYVSTHSQGQMNPDRAAYLQRQAQNQNRPTVSGPAPHFTPQSHPVQPDPVIRPNTVQENAEPNEVEPTTTPAHTGKSDKEKTEFDPSTFGSKKK